LRYLRPLLLLLRARGSILEVFGNRRRVITNSSIQNRVYFSPASTVRVSKASACIFTLKLYIQSQMLHSTAAISALHYPSSRCHTHNTPPFQFRFAFRLGILGRLPIYPLTRASACNTVPFLLITLLRLFPLTSPSSLDILSIQS
jgi:hypothetical protein